MYFGLRRVALRNKREFLGSRQRLYPKKRLVFRKAETATSNTIISKTMGSRRWHASPYNMIWGMEK